MNNIYSSVIKITSVWLAVLTIFGLAGACVCSKDIHNKHVLKETFTARANSIAEAMRNKGSTDFEIAESIADDVKAHMSYDYTVKSPWYHNLTVVYTTAAFNAYEKSELTGICTDFSKIYSTMLQSINLDSYDISREKVVVDGNTYEHAYVIAKLDGQHYKIDITSYCTAEHNNAPTDFSNYVELL